MLIDSHCHLEMPHYKDEREQIIERALAAGVRRLLTVGTNLPDSRRVVQIAAQHEPVYCSIGIHPHDAKDASEQSYAELRELAEQPKVVAYGEIGLDFFKNYSPHDVQIREFTRQIRLARDLNLPIIIHDRDAHQETVDILKSEGGTYRGVFHCFAGDEAMAEQVMDLGFLLSFTGSITFGKKMKAHRVIRQAPLDRIMVETDAPFLTPVPHRGKRNEPAYVRFVAEKIAELKETTVEEVEWFTTDNAYRLFRFETFGKLAAIVYPWKKALYINLTSRCSNRCLFCAKHPAFTLGPHYLRLEENEEPTVDDVLAEISDTAAHEEIVFCGYGEPTIRWDEMIRIAKALKKRGARRIRLNTNGLAELIHDRPLAKEMKGVIDAVSVSLNAPDAGAYAELCNPQQGERAYHAVLDFIGQAKRYVPEVVASVVTVADVDLPAVRKLAEQQLGVPLRERP